MRAPDVPVVVADRLLDQHVLPGLESREGQLLVAVAPPASHHIDHVDVAPVQNPLGVGDRFGNVELLRGGIGKVLVQVADHDHVAQR